MATKYEDLVRAEDTGEDDDAPEGQPDGADGEPDTSAAPDTEPDQPAEQPQPAVGEAEVRKVQRANKTYRDRLEALLGAEAVAHDCPLCTSLGFLAELPPAGSRFTIAEHEGETVLLFEPPEQVVELETDPGKILCEVCKGHGQLRTPSLQPANRVVVCSRCSGLGYQERPLDYTMQQQQQPPVYLPPPIDPNQTDQWGRRPGEQYFGVDPQFVPAPVTPL